MANVGTSTEQIAAALKGATKEQIAAALEGMSQERVAAFAGAALGLIEAGGRLPFDVFGPIRQRARMSTVEVVAFQAGTNGERVLIGQRTSDPQDWWSGQLNLPGSVILPNEALEPEDLVMSNGRRVDLRHVTVSKDLTTPTNRILREEFNGSVRRTAPVEKLERYWVNGSRSTETKTWVLTEAELNPAHEYVLGGNFYDTQEIIASPPENLVVGHEYFIDLGFQALQAS